MKTDNSQEKKMELHDQQNELAAALRTFAERKALEAGDQSNAVDSSSEYTSTSDTTLEASAAEETSHLSKNSIYTNVLDRITTLLLDNNILDKTLNKKHSSVYFHNEDDKKALRIIDDMVEILSAYGNLEKAQVLRPTKHLSNITKDGRINSPLRTNSVLDAGKSVSAIDVVNRIASLLSQSDEEEGNLYSVKMRRSDPIIKGTENIFNKNEIPSKTQTGETPKINISSTDILNKVASSLREMTLPQENVLFTSENKYESGPETQSAESFQKLSDRHSNSNIYIAINKQLMSSELEERTNFDVGASKSISATNIIQKSASVSSIQGSSCSQSRTTSRPKGETINLFNSAQNRHEKESSTTIHPRDLSSIHFNNSSKHNIDCSILSKCSKKSQEHGCCEYSCPCKPHDKSNQTSPVPTPCQSLNTINSKLLPYSSLHIRFDPAQGCTSVRHSPRMREVGVATSCCCCRDGADDDRHTTDQVCQTAPCCNRSSREGHVVPKWLENQGCTARQGRGMAGMGFFDSSHTSYSSKISKSYVPHYFGHSRSYKSSYLNHF